VLRLRNSSLRTSLFCFILFETGFCYVTQGDLKLKILLPPTSQVLGLQVYTTIFTCNVFLLLLLQTWVCYFCNLYFLLNIIS
jgi:hypothetical protein